MIKVQKLLGEVDFRIQGSFPPSPRRAKVAVAPCLKSSSKAKHLSLVQPTQLTPIRQTQSTEEERQKDSTCIHTVSAHTNMKKRLDPVLSCQIMRFKDFLCITQTPSHVHFHTGLL